MRKIICDLCKQEVPAIAGQLAIGKMDVEGRPVDIIELCPECRKKIIENFGIKEYVEPAPEPEAAQ